MERVHRVGAWVLVCAASAGLGAWAISGVLSAGPGAKVLETSARPAQVAAGVNAVKVRFELLRRAGTGDGGWDSVETQLVVLRSRAVLERVVRDASVRKSRWASALRVNEPEGEERAIGRLGEMVVAAGIPGTGFFDLTVKADDSVDARLLANVIADAFVMESQIRQRAVDVPLQTLLSERLRDIDASLSSLESQRDIMVHSRGITSIDPGCTLSQIRAEPMVRELAEAKANRVTPQAQDGTEEERVQRAENALEHLRQIMVDESRQLLLLRGLQELRDTAFARRERTQAQLDDLTVQMQAGPVVRVVERPAVPLGGDEKGA